MADREAQPAGPAFLDLRPLLLSIAYRMLGSYSDAEDIVQEAFLRLHRATTGDGDVEYVKAFLITVTTRLAIDQLRSARASRETYAGPWLPEPVVDEYADLADEAALSDSLSTAFLLVLERLSPEQRAVFLLRDVFGYPFDEIASIVVKTPAACRQIAVRARRHVNEGRPRFDTSPRERDELARRFFAACHDGDLEGLVSLLAADVTFTGDGGGKAKGLPRPVTGRPAVGRLLRAALEQLAQLMIRLEPVHVGGQPGARLSDAEGRLIGVWSLGVAGGEIVAIHSVVNPDKLAHLKPR
jgi:RNA polymerase sigma-70 factor (TIGR02957 family)